MLELFAQQVDLSPLPKVTPSGDNVQNVLNAAFVVAALLAIAFVAFGGFQYTISSGDSNGIARAKNTIIYALIGLAVTLSAAVIVNFVIGRV